MTDQQSSTSSSAAEAGADEDRIREGASATVNGSGSSEVLTGTGADDIINGFAGDDSLFGGAGADTIIGGDGSDFIDGESGNDVVDYSSEGGAVTVSLALGEATDGSGGTDTLSSIENVIGSAFNDSLTGSIDDNVITAGTGNDTLDGRAGNDTLDGGDNTDTASYAEAPDGAVVNLTTGTASDGFGWTDTLINIENATGSASSDDIVGNSGNNVLLGGDGNDEITGLEGADLIEGQGGADTVDGGADDDQVEGGDGDDIVLGGKGNDILIGGGGADVIDGGADTDTLFLEVDGEPGADATSFTIVNLSTGIVESDGIVLASTGATSTDTVSNIENVVGSDQNDTITGSDVVNTLTGGEGADTLRGLIGNDTLDGGNGADTLFGGSNDDVLIGGAGRDILHGGDGHDVIDYSAETSRLQLDLALGSARTTADNVDTIIAVEQITGTALNDSMRGDKFANEFDGIAGDDVLRGQGGQDTLNGGLGNDLIEGGTGNDILDGGDGDDVINGGAGDDSITAGLGDDTIDGGGGIDNLFFSGEWGDDSVSASEGGAYLRFSDSLGVSINSVPNGNDLDVNVAGKLSTVKLVNFVGNEGNFILLDENDEVVNVGGAGTTQATAHVVEADTQLLGRVGDGINPEDFYTFTAPTDGQATLSISGAAAGVTVQFLNTSGGVIGTTTTDASGNASVTIDAVRSETYVANLAAGSETAYSMDLSFNAQNLDDSVSNPVNVDLPFMLTELTLDAVTNPTDAYRIVAPDNMTLVINTSHVTGDFDLRIYDSAGNLLKESTTVGPAAEGMTFQVTQGVAYIVEVVAQDASVTGNLQLTLEELDDAGSNGSIETATPIPSTTSLTGDVGIDPNFADYYSFTVDTAGEVTLRLTGLQDDLRIDLFDGDGVRIGQAQTGGTADELLVQTVAAGTYFVGVVALTTIDASPYALDVSFGVPDAADTLSSANAFGGFPLDVTQSVGSGSDSADYYSFTPTADGTISADVSGLTANIGIQGFDQNGVRVADSSLGNTLDKSIVFEVVGGQTYYVGALPTSDGAAGDYRLQADYVEDAGNALETPTNVDPNFSRTEAIGFNGDSDDNYRIISSDAGTLVVNVSNASAPVDLHLYTADGTRVDSSLNSGTADEQISFDLEANVAYVVAVTPTSSSAQGFYDINSSFSVSSNAQAAAQVNVVDEDQVGS